MVKKSQGVNQGTLEPTNTTLIESISDTSIALSSYPSTPSTTLVLIARVQKLEAQMATLLHHIQPWIQKYIIEAKE